MFKWELDRPLAILDIEATGINPRMDRIIDLAFITLMPDGKRETFTFRVHPEMPIPPETTAIHGITDQDVAGHPNFKTLAPSIYKLLDPCDFGGYNIIRFDLPMLIEEFVRASINLSMEGRRIIDAQRIFHKREPRDLKAALAFYCDELSLDSHHAEADALATLRVLEGQLRRYSDLPHSVEGLDKYCALRDPSWADRDGKLKWVSGDLVVNFGKKKGTNLAHLAQTDPNFLKWILKGDFSTDTKSIVSDVLKGKKPVPINSGISDQLRIPPEGDASPV
jgi:DNA polymerase III subunit epsilon